MKPFVVVTGAAGMIGSGVVRALNDCGVTDLLLVDDLKQGQKWKNLVGKQFSSLISKRSLLSFLQGKQDLVQAIIHLGACSSTIEIDADYLWENNTRYTISLAEWALTHGKRFVYASSAATYGDGSCGFDDNHDALSTLRPLNMYGYSKHAVDLWMKKENVLHLVCGLKYFNVFGPNEYHKGPMASMVMKMCHKAHTEGRIGLFRSNDPARFKDGDQVRDFIYIKDAASWTACLIDPKWRHVCGIYNIGSGQTTTWNRLALALFQALGRAPTIEYIPMPEALTNQYQNYTCASMEKLRKIFPDVRAMNVEHSIADYVTNYLLPQAYW
ncbi:MAG: hypothetical protein RL235_1076 [Chlamydiota bacterium]|jgi:ADP-L-glycero-D-manno-heptose 6-epimerase